ncbi:MFS transporter [Zafaria sp. J156]|uniref:MFS transporter n=1 Tax=Zafaria sp. J156 TaxID=3116490 RepID=UPI002E767F35|nr:MFS transporter [Zafaria sp. J156]MEE1620702.1 MFS transporter [Zafaria sp. J156]
MADSPTAAGTLPRVPGEIKVLICAAFVIAIGFGLIAPVLPQFARSFDVGIVAAGFIVSVFAVTRLAFAPASGRMTDRLGEPVVYVGGVLVVAVSTLLCAVADGYVQLLFFRALGGIGSTMFTVSAMALITRLAPPQIRGRISGYYATAFLTGNIAGPVLGGLVAGFGYRLPFFIYGGALVVAAAIVYFSLLGVGGRRRARTTDLRPKLGFRAALASPVYRACLASGFANGWSTFGVRVALVPLFAVQTFSNGVAIAGISLALFAAGNAATLGLGGRLADTWGRRGPVLAGLATASIATLLFGFADTVPLFIALSVLAGAGTGLMNPAQQAAVADVVGQDHQGGQALAGFQMATDLGAIAGPVAAGLLADAYGYGWAFAATGLVGLLGTATWLGVPPSRSAPAAG